MAGYGGIVSLAVAAFVGVGSYGTAEVAAKAGWGLIPSVLAGGLVAVAFALVVAVPMLRFRGLYFTIGSLVLAEALGIFMSNFNGFGGKTGHHADWHRPVPADHLPLLVRRRGGRHARRGLLVAAGSASG